MGRASDPGFLEALVGQVGIAGLAALVQSSSACGSLPFEPNLDFPPDNVEVVSGTWGIDFDEDPDNHLSSNRSILFKATTPTDDPSIQTEQFVEAIEGDPYTAEFVAQANSIASGNTFKAEIVWYDVNKVELSTSTVHNAVLTAANTWETLRATAVAPTNTRYVKVRATKKRNAFTVNLDGWALENAVPMLRVSRATTNQSGLGNGETIVFNSEQSNTGIEYDDVDGVVTIVAPGLYSVIAGAVVNGLDNGSLAYLTVEHNNAELVAGPLSYNWSGSVNLIAAHVSATVAAAAGDTIWIEIRHDDPATVDVMAATHTYMHIVKVE